MHLVNLTETNPARAKIPTLAIYSVASTEAFADSDVLSIPFAAELTVKKILPESPNVNISTPLPPSFFLLLAYKGARKR